MATDRTDEKVWDFDSYSWADRYDDVVQADQDMYARYDDVLDAVADIACTFPGAQVLDIGAGTGNLSIRCAERGARVTGLDPSRRMLAQAEAKVAARPETKAYDVQFALADDPFLHLPFDDNSFDAVVSTYAFHHVAHELQPKALCEMMRVLRPGRVLALGDVAFRDAAAEEAAREQLDWLDDEFYLHVDELTAAVATVGASLQTRQMTPTTWVLWVVKPEATRHRGGGA
ncbi:MAG: class I SAM-dependent methyltransferase [Bacillota bacterium]|jgi:putative AdoMet-dependent methyltransferase